mgnify:CR=1 FL=1|jgi:hypothetical protein
MSGKPAASDCDHPTYPGYADRFGEDPARILYHINDPEARIRGLESVALVRAYLDVETDRDEPRGEVVATLNRRQRELEAAQADAEAAVATDGGE